MWIGLIQLKIGKNDWTRKRTFGIYRTWGISYHAEKLSACQEELYSKQLGSSENTLGTQNNLDSCIMGTGSFPGIQRTGRGDDHPLPSAEFNEMSYTCTPVPLGLLQGAIIFTQNHFACWEVPKQLLPQPGFTVKLHPHYIYGPPFYIYGPSFYIYGPPFCWLLCSHSVPSWRIHTEAQTWLSLNVPAEHNEHNEHQSATRFVIRSAHWRTSDYKIMSLQETSFLKTNRRSDWDMNDRSTKKKVTIFGFSVT